MEKRTISIVGATGNMGTALSKSLAKAGHRLFLYSTDEEKAKKLIQEIGGPESDVQALRSLKEVGRKADIIILAVPYEAEQELAQELGDFVQEKIVISISNPLNSSYDGLVTDPVKSAAEELQEALPRAKVVKSFNTVFAADYDQPNIGGKQIDAFVAGDDEDAVNQIAEIVKSMGLNPLISGRLSTSRTLENMQLLMIQLNLRNNYNWLAGWKILHN